MELDLEFDSVAALEVRLELVMGFGLKCETEWVKLAIWGTFTYMFVG